MIVSCLYMCLCSRFIETSDDGHMRLMCCGKPVTGIGNVPQWNPPVRKRTKSAKAAAAEEKSDAELIKNEEVDGGGGSGDTKEVDT